MIKILIKDISQDGVKVSERVLPDVFDLAPETGFALTGEAEVAGNVTRVDDTVVAHLFVRLPVRGECGRCLQGVEFDVKKDFYQDYPIERTTDFIDLSEDIRQEVILSLPAKVLCKEDCNGICPDCGMNLNEDTCRCNNK